MDRKINVDEALITCRLTMQTIDKSLAPSTTAIRCPFIFDVPYQHKLIRYASRSCRPTSATSLASYVTTRYSAGRNLIGSRAPSPESSSRLTRQPSISVGTASSGALTRSRLILLQTWRPSGVWTIQSMLQSSHGSFCYAVPQFPRAPLRDSKHAALQLYTGRC